MCKFVVEYSTGFVICSERCLLKFIQIVSDRLTDRSRCCYECASERQREATTHCDKRGRRRHGVTDEFLWVCVACVPRSRTHTRSNSFTSNDMRRVLRAIEMTVCRRRRRYSCCCHVLMPVVCIWRKTALFCCSVRRGAVLGDGDGDDTNTIQLKYSISVRWDARACAYYMWKIAK